MGTKVVARLAACDAEFEPAVFEVDLPADRFDPYLAGCDAERVLDAAAVEVGRVNGCRVELTCPRSEEAPRVGGPHRFGSSHRVVLARPDESGGSAWLEVHVT